MTFTFTPATDVFFYEYQSPWSTVPLSLTTHGHRTQKRVVLRSHTPLQLEAAISDSDINRYRQQGVIVSVDHRDVLS